MQPVQALRHPFARMRCKVLGTGVYLDVDKKIGVTRDLDEWHAISTRLPNGLGCARVFAFGFSTAVLAEPVNSVHTNLRHGPNVCRHRLHRASQRCKASDGQVVQSSTSSDCRLHPTRFGATARPRVTVGIPIFRDRRWRLVVFSVRAFPGGFDGSLGNRTFTSNRPRLGRWASLSQSFERLTRCQCSDEPLRSRATPSPAVARKIAIFGSWLLLVPTRRCFGSLQHLRRGTGRLCRTRRHRPCAEPEVDCRQTINRNRNSDALDNTGYFLLANRLCLCLQRLNLSGQLCVRSGLRHGGSTQVAMGLEA